MFIDMGGCFFFFFKQKTAYEMCGRDWSSDVCSSDLNQYIVSQYIVSQYTVIKWCILLIVFYNSCFVFIFYYLRFIFILTGVVMISGALCADAIIGNVQEKTMKQFSASNAEVVSDSMYGVVYTTCCQFSTLVPCAAIIDQQV